MSEACRCVEALKKILAKKMRHIWDLEAKGKIGLTTAVQRSKPYERMGTFLDELAGMERCR